MHLYHLGRNRENEIQIDGETVSRKHAQLFIDDDGTAFLIDLNSTNGTFVNGNRVEGRIQLKKGDRILLGESPFDWESHLPQASIPATQPEATSYQEPQVASRPGPSFIRKNGLWIGIPLLLVIGLALFLILNKGGEAQLIGKWQESSDPQAWIHFGEKGKYEEGYGPATIFAEAKWEKRNKNALLITKDSVTVIYTYTFQGDELTITHNEIATHYQKSP